MRISSRVPGRLYRFVVGAALLLATAASGVAQDCEREYLEEVLRRTGWNVTRAAELLGLQRSHLHARIRDLGLQRPGREGGDPSPGAP